MRAAPLFTSSRDKSDKETSDDLQAPIGRAAVTAESLLASALGRAARTLSTRSECTSDESATFLAARSILNHVATAATKKSNASKAETATTLHDLQLSSDSILQGTVGRAMRTLSTRATGEDPIDTNAGVSTSSSLDSDSVEREKKAKEQGNDGNYLTNPAISPTALAHQLWSHVLTPNVDTAIDATCGNGHDSVAIASMIFARNDDDKDHDESSLSTSSGNHVAQMEQPQSQLVCIDIQEKACEQTRQKLSQVLHADTMTRHVNVICTSHSPLPAALLREKQQAASVGLVCYNLGYLPGRQQQQQQQSLSNNDDNDNATQGGQVQTQVDTTISSIADAALMVRVGGMISVTTYPRSNRNEDIAVRALLEGLALLSSKTMDWKRDVVDQLGPDLHPDDSDNDDNDKAYCYEYTYSVKEAVRAALDRIVNEQASCPTPQAWRVMEHRMLGRSLSPTLLTATRIK